METTRASYPIENDHQTLSKYLPYEAGVATPVSVRMKPDLQITKAECSIHLDLWIS